MIAIRVTRNRRTPRFNNLPAAIPLPQNTAVDTVVFEVEATDEDEADAFNTLTYSIVGDDNAPAFFRVNNQGQILVNSDLRSAPGSEIEYKVG